MINSKSLMWLLAWYVCVPLQAQVDNKHSNESVGTVVATSAVHDSVSRTMPLLDWPSSVRNQLSQLLEDKLFNTSQVGLMVYDLTADSTLFAYNERQMMRPGSIMKLLTAITALDKLGGNYQFKTELYYDGKIENRTLTGDVYCVGGFDPCFSHDDMHSFLSCVKDLGIDTIRGNLFADKTMKDLNTLGEGWCWDDDNPILSPLLYNRKDHFMDQFEDELRSDGIRVEAFSSTGRKPANAKLLCVRTHTIDQILLDMMKESDNLYAEAMFYQIAAQGKRTDISAKDSRVVINQLIHDVSANATDCRIADGSGLSLYNYVTVKLLVNFLKYAYHNDAVYRHLLPVLPVAGVDGTLKDRLTDASTRGKVWAKTGTLTGISSLAGYCQAPNGHLLCFAIINQGIMRSKFGHVFQDKVCHVLRKP